MSRNVFTIILIVTVLAVARGVLAETVIKNNVSSSASTGGNQASGGSVIQGESSASVSIETVVNGQVVTDIQETKVSIDGTPVEIELSASYDDSASQTNLDPQVTEPSETGTGNDSTNESEPKVLSKFFTWLINIFKDVFSIFT
jgi:hypothetical protein